MRAGLHRRVHIRFASQPTDFDSRVSVHRPIVAASHVRAQVL
jgi:hypothetical protein